MVSFVTTIEQHDHGQNIAWGALENGEIREEHIHPLATVSKLFLQGNICRDFATRSDRHKDNGDLRGTSPVKPLLLPRLLFLTTTYRIDKSSC